MRIQHNITAMNSYRNYTNNTSAVAKNLEKLSSGYKINRAGDDAAGLAISEKMRAQITGLQTAQKNAKDGISLVKTGEGALTEVHDMLNRMFELAEQSSNGTYDNEVDRANLQKEITSLKSEIDRIADSVNFNGINLLDGSLSSGSTTALGDSVPFKLSEAQFAGMHTYQPVAGAQSFTPTGVAATMTNGQALNFEIKYQDASGAVHTTKITGSVTDTKLTVTRADGTTKDYTVTDKQPTAAQLGAVLKGELAEDDTLNANFDIAVTDASGKVAFTSKEKGTNGASILSITQTVHTTTSAETVATDTAASDKSYGIKINQAGTANTVTGYEGTGNVNDYVFEVGGKKFAFVTDGNQDKLDPDVNYIITADADAISDPEAQDMVDLIGQKTGITGLTHDAANDAIKFSAATKASGGGLTLQIGDTADDFNKLTVSIKDMHTAAMGIDAVDISKQGGASDAMKVIKSAINYVSDVRGDLGATQNRLEHTINNLSVMQENIQDAESSIRDVDVAEEMMAYTKNNILVQSAQAMLAQANQLPQGVLQLLQ